MIANTFLPDFYELRTIKLPSFGNNWLTGFYSEGREAIAGIQSNMTITMTSHLMLLHLTWLGNKGSKFIQLGFISLLSWTWRNCILGLFQILKAQNFKNNFSFTITKTSYKWRNFLATQMLAFLSSAFLSDRNQSLHFYFKFGRKPNSAVSFISNVATIFTAWSSIATVARQKFLMTPLAGLSII